MNFEKVDSAYMHGIDLNQDPHTRKHQEDFTPIDGLLYGEGRGPQSTAQVIEKLRSNIK